MGMKGRLRFPGRRRTKQACVKTMGVWGLLIALFLSGMAYAGEGQGWRVVRGKALQAFFADQELGDGVHYANQFHRDGSLTGMNMGKRVRGTWKVSGQSLCYVLSRSGSEEECYEVKHSGNEVRLFRYGYEAFSGTLTPIPPRPSKE